MQHDSIAESSYRSFLQNYCAAFSCIKATTYQKIHDTVLNKSKLRKKMKPNRNRTEPNRFKVFCDIKNVAHSLEPGETPSKSASHQASNYIQRS